MENPWLWTIQIKSTHFLHYWRGEACFQVYDTEKATKGGAFSGNSDCAQETKMEKGGRKCKFKKRNRVYDFMYTALTWLWISKHVCLQSILSAPWKSVHIEFQAHLQRMTARSSQQIASKTFWHVVLSTWHAHMILHNIYAIPKCDLCYVCYWNA